MVHHPTQHRPCESDFLVLGSGVAGLRAAVELGAAGKTTVMSKGGVYDSCSMYAQGGVAAAIHEDDDVTIHIEDTLRAGCGRCREEAVLILAREAPDAIRELLSWGAHFDMENGQFAFAREGAHSRNRVLRAGGDATGNEVVRTLLRQANTCDNITWKTNRFAIDLILEDGICCGVIALDESSGAIEDVRASSIVLATGGAGQVYARTTNPMSATGDGIAMAYRAGANIKDMEFVQFHPTTLSLPSGPQFLLSETMRGEGGTLRNVAGETFMLRYHPAGDLAPRDVVTRAIWSEIMTTNAPHVYLDMTHLPAKHLRERFPTIYTTCLEFGIDITTTPIPVLPSAHYVMGGVFTDLGGETTIPGLYAAGEVACSGVHGANRLASNSLLEGLVFGKRAARSALGFGLKRRSLPPQILKARQWTNSQNRPAPMSDEDLAVIKQELRRVMWEKVGILRSRTSLLDATDHFSKWSDIVSRHYTTRGALEVKNLVTVGQCMTTAALLREESIGAHYRTDFPPPDDIHSAVPSAAASMTLPVTNILAPSPSRFSA